MRLPAALVMCCLATLPAIAQNAARGSADDAAVREIVRKYVDAREKRDAKLLEALFTADAQAAATRRMRTTFVVVRSAAASAAGTNARRIAAIRNMASTDPAR
jgi:type IV secretory pathway component VirB8